jgi:hypothetical protein
MKKSLISSALIVTLSSVISFQAHAAASMEEAEQAIAAADAAIKKAASVNGEWRDSKKFLQQAQEATKNGDNDKAVKLAKQARMEGELGFNQAMGQQEAGPWAF